MTFVVNITSNGVFVKRKERDVHKKRSIGQRASRQRSEVRSQRSEGRKQRTDDTYEK
jgi:hypothetical protein